MDQIKVTVLGAGSWGTALANVAAENGHAVNIWGHRATIVDEINTQHTNTKYLNDYTLHNDISATTDLIQAVDGAEIIFSVVPMKATREIAILLNQTLKKLNQKSIVVVATKGLEPLTYKFASQVILEEIDIKYLAGVAAIAGPSHAEGVIKHDPTTVVAVSENLIIAEKLQNVMSNSSFRVYTNNDVIGAELGGALKNVIAIAAGILKSLNYDANAKAALFTRGLSEMVQLGKSYGANPTTFMGLSGMGDLFATATSIHSRNFRAGMQLGLGLSKKEVIEHMGMVIEGISTTKVVHELAQVKKVEMPIFNAVYKVVYEGCIPKKVIKELMERPFTSNEGK